VKRTTIRKTTSWKSEETLTLVSKEVQKSPDNLSYAFKQIARKLGTTEGAVMNAWYTKVKNQMPQFATGSAKNVFVNRKNTPKKDIDTFLHEKVVSTQNVHGVKVVTLVRYYAS
jgi:hypothetical protein